MISNKHLCLLLISSFILSFSADIVQPAPSTLPEKIGTVPAFPGAEGPGMYTTGGRGGKVLFVSNLGDGSIPGTLRWAVDQNYPRTIIFTVSGTIRLTKSLTIKYGNLTIAGQSAPGDGICIRDYPVHFQEGVSNVIIRFLRFRLGDETLQEDDAFTGSKLSDIIIDHCSLSWSVDETASFYNNRRFTMQWCILSESLTISVHEKGSHGYCGIWGGQEVSFHHNLLANHLSRNPRFCGSRYTGRPDLEFVDFRNNVIFNWGANSGYGGEGGHYNMINNYYHPGPASSPKQRIFAANNQSPNGDGSVTNVKGVWGTFFLAGNHMTHLDGTCNEYVSNNNFNGFDVNVADPKYPATKEQLLLKEPKAFSKPEYQPYTHAAIDSFEKVKLYAGASLVRDDTDKRIINTVSQTGEITFSYAGSKSGLFNGLIDSQVDVNGWVNLMTKPYPENTLGLPNEWAIRKGLDPTRFNVYSRELNANYTNLEVYLNELVENITNEQK